MNISEIIILGVSCIASYYIGYKVCLWLDIKAIEKVYSRVDDLHNEYENKLKEHQEEIKRIKSEYQKKLDKLGYENYFLKFGVPYDKNHTITIKGDKR